jgi:GNAT superfamily N-acetyltransferase
MIIRESNQNEFEELSIIGRRYASETLLGSISDDQINNIILSCSKNGIVYVAEIDGRIVGVIAGIIVDGFLMGRFVEEVLWYVEPEHRGVGVLLYAKFEEACREKGCYGIAMSAYNNKYLSVVDRFYRRNGYKEIDRKYFKILKGE